MKTIKQAIESSSIDPRLIRGVVKQLGGMSEARQSMPDIVEHGIYGGFNGFIYCTETVEFFKKYRRSIVAIVESRADSIGEIPETMVANFAWLTDDRELRQSSRRCLGGGRLTDDDDVVANALAWFAGEEVSRAFCEDDDESYVNPSPKHPSEKCTNVVTQAESDKAVSLWNDTVVAARAEIDKILGNNE